MKHAYKTKVTVIWTFCLTLLFSLQAQGFQLVPLSNLSADTDDISCVSRNVSVKPPSFAVPMVQGDTSFFATVSYAANTPVACPESQVPIHKRTTQGWAKGNPLLDPDSPEGEANFLPYEDVQEMNSRQLSFSPMFATPSCDGISQHNSCYYYGSALNYVPSDGAGMHMRIQRPTVLGDGHSLDEIALHGGAQYEHLVELGWRVSPTHYGDSDPHLFVFHWVNNVPACYDGCGWVQVSSKYFPGMSLKSFIGKSVYVGYRFLNGNWWAWFDGEWIGYFPGSKWSGQFTKTTANQWFGEVASDNGIPPLTDMGNGKYPFDLTSAINSRLCNISNIDNLCRVKDDHKTIVTRPGYYNIMRYSAGLYRFGGPGEITLHNTGTAGVF